MVQRALLEDIRLLDGTETTAGKHQVVRWYKDHCWKTSGSRMAQRPLLEDIR